MKALAAAILAIVFMVAASAVAWRASERSKTAAASASRQEDAARRARGLRRPKLEVDHLEYDFGVMNVGQSGRHTFLVRNAGTADLELQQGGTTCKCTLLGMPDGRIPPGETRRVQLEWKAEKATETFRHGAGIWTNDPDHRQIKLVLTGKVRAFLGCTADDIVFADVGRNDRRTHRITLFSQHWSEFEITRVASSLANLSWRIEPADPETLVSLSATSGYTLELALDPDLPMGTFDERLRIYITTGQAGLEEIPSPIELPVRGNRASSYSFYGPLIKHGVIQLGAIGRDQGARHRLYMYVRDGGQDFKIDEIRVMPDFLKVRLIEDETLATQRARFRMEIEVPPGAPLADYMGSRLGRIELVTNHPQRPNAEVSVQFAVHP